MLVYINLLKCLQIKTDIENRCTGSSFKQKKPLKPTYKS